MSLRGRGGHTAEEVAGGHDPDQVVFAQAARRVGVQVAVLSAAMILIGATLLFAYLGWRLGAGADRPREGGLLVSLEPGDVAVAGLVLGVSAIAASGVTAVWSARRATEPLAEALRRQRRFVSDASHELRTPLAVLSARAQHLSLMTAGDVRLSAVAADLRADVAVMSHLVDELLASATSGEATAGHCDVGAVAAEVVEGLAVSADATGVRIVLASSPQAWVALSEVAVRRVLTAVIDNAVRHSPAGKSVSVTPRVRRDVVEVDVADRGPGIRGIAPERVFERFARGVPPLGAAASSSHGIGLALVSDVLSERGGAIAVLRTGPEGTIFRLTLPASAPAQEPFDGE